jgi:hypothetical protein
LPNPPGHLLVHSSPKAAIAITKRRFETPDKRGCPKSVNLDIYAANIAWMALATPKRVTPTP